MIQRAILQDLQSHLPHKEISLIVGPRQAGKTTAILSLRDELQKAGQPTVYLNLDIEADRQFFSSQETLIKKIQLEIGPGKGYIFIDEIQRKQNAGLFLKGIYDMNLPYKFVVTGSGSVELKEKIHESLAGRKRLFEFTTVTFEEFVQFKTEYRYQDRLEQFFELERHQTDLLLQEYLAFGGYPKVILAPTIEEKRRIMAEIYESYVEKDIQVLLGVQNTDAFSNLIKMLAAQIGRPVNVAELASTLGVSAITVNNYLWYLQQTYIVNKVTPFFSNARSEISKSPLFYFHDTGLRNFALGTFSVSALQPRDAGYVFENMLLNILKKKTRDTATGVHYWRSKDGAEVDFVLRAGTDAIPFEVKYTALSKPELTRSFRSFLDKYSPERAYVIHTGDWIGITIRSTQINLVPYWRLERAVRDALRIPRFRRIIHS